MELESVFPEPVLLLVLAFASDSPPQPLFREFCSEGQLHAARRLAILFELTATDAREDDNFALRWTGSEGHLEVARWLTETFGLTAADARSRDNAALQMASKKRHIAVKRWLIATFGE
jgi:hypothetical protein